MRDENKLLSHHLAKAIKYLENIVYPLWEPRLFLMDSTPRFFFNELHNVHIKLKNLSLALLSLTSHRNRFFGKVQMIRQTTKITAIQNQNVLYLKEPISKKSVACQNGRYFRPKPKNPPSSK